MAFLNQHRDVSDSFATKDRDDEHDNMVSTEPENEDLDLPPLEDGQLEENDVQSLLAVSISRAQSWLASPRTPALEKAAALEQLDGGGLFDDIPADYQDGKSEELRTPPPAHETPKDVSSPWQTDPKRSSTEVIIQKEAIPIFHQKSSSGTTFFGPDNALRRLMATPLPSLPKASTFSNFIPNQISFFAPANGPEKPQASGTRPKRSSTLFSNTPLPWNVFASKSDSQSPVLNVTDQKVSGTDLHASTAKGQEMGLVNPTFAGHDKPGSLRRVNSDGSLRLLKSVSRVSSLGDDTHFDDVQGQVNSRFKAIKDSFADSSFKFPSKKLSSPLSKTIFTTDRTLLDDRKANGNNRQSALADIENSPDKQTQSHLQSALESLTGDIVVLGGYRGSVLRSAKPPYRQLWAPVKVGLGIRKVDLEVGLEPEAEENMKNTIKPAGMLTHIGPVDISRRLLKKLQQCRNSRNGTLRVWNYGYDWRMSPHLLSKDLSEFLASLPSNQPGAPPDERGAVVIAHSLGGLITRHAINKNPSLVRGVVYASVPQSCVNILGPLRNGDDVLLTSRVLTAQVNFTLRTSYALLPESGTCFFDKKTGEEYKVNFFDIDTWINHRLSPCVVSPFPPPDLPTAGLSSLIGSISSSLPSLSISTKRTASPDSRDRVQSPSTQSNGRSQTPPHKNHPTANEDIRDKLSSVAEIAEAPGSATIAPQMGRAPVAGTSSSKGNEQPNPTLSTLDIREAIVYLHRTLKEIEIFKKELHAQPELLKSDAYPPIAVLFGKSIPTVKGARVASLDAIKYSSAFDDLIFGAGDGVVLAEKAMVPDGYKVVSGGRVSSDRGHVTLLGDLEGVGRCLLALQNASGSSARGKA